MLNEKKNKMIRHTITRLVPHYTVLRPDECNCVCASILKVSCSVANVQQYKYRSKATDVVTNIVQQIQRVAGCRPVKLNYTFEKPFTVIKLSLLCMTF